MENTKTKKYLLKKEPKQGEFEGLPPKDDLVKAAENYLCGMQELQICKEQVDKDREELVAAFQKDGRDKLKIDGKCVSYQHVEKDQIRVEKPKG
jgi:hypothetical protein